MQIHRSGFTGELGYEVYCKIEDTQAVEDAIRAACDKFNAPELTTLEVYVRSLPVEKGFALRQDMYGLTLRCNAIAPGGVLTDIPLVMPPSNEFGFGRTSALLAYSPEMGMPEDIANAALFLASNESAFVNGAVITCDRGWTSF